MNLVLLFFWLYLEQVNLVKLPYQEIEVSECRSV